MFFSVKGVVYCEFLPQGQTIDQWFYVELLRGNIHDVMVIVWGNEGDDSSSNAEHDYFAHHITLIPLRKVWIQLFSFQLWVKT